MVPPAGPERHSHHSQTDSSRVGSLPNRSKKRALHLLKLRAQMLNQLPQPLPRTCRLPHRYQLERVAQRSGCQDCNGRLSRVRTSTHFPVGLMLGQPRVKWIHRKCDRCGKLDRLDEYQQLVPPHGNYAYDLIVHVGLSRLRDQRQDVEIVNDLFQRYGLELPQGSVRSLVDSFLDGLAAIRLIHQRCVNVWSKTAVMLCI